MFIAHGACLCNLNSLQKVASGVYNFCALYSRFFFHFCTRCDRKEVSICDKTYMASNTRLYDLLYLPLFYVGLDIRSENRWEPELHFSE